MYTSWNCFNVCIAFSSFNLEPVSYFLVLLFHTNLPVSGTIYYKYHVIHHCKEKLWTLNAVIMSCIFLYESACHMSVARFVTSFMSLHHLKENYWTLNAVIMSCIVLYESACHMSVARFDTSFMLIHECTKKLWKFKLVIISAPSTGTSFILLRFILS